MVLGSRQYFRVPTSGTMRSTRLGSTDLSSRGATGWSNMTTTAAVGVAGDCGCRRNTRNESCAARAPGTTAASIRAVARREILITNADRPVQPRVTPRGCRLSLHWCLQKSQFQRQLYIIGAMRETGSLSFTRCLYVSTVLGLIASCSPISGAVYPSAINRITARSRSVRRS